MHREIVATGSHFKYKMACELVAKSIITKIYTEFPNTLTDFLQIKSTKGLI